MSGAWWRATHHPSQKAQKALFCQEPGGEQHRHKWLLCHNGAPSVYRAAACHGDPSLAQQHHALDTPGSTYCLTPSNNGSSPSEPCPKARKRHLQGRGIDVDAGLGTCSASTLSTWHVHAAGNAVLVFEKLPTFICTHSPQINPHFRKYSNVGSSPHTALFRKLGALLEGFSNRSCSNPKMVQKPGCKCFRRQEERG